ncbi:MAG: hypothetical protein IT299_11085 [Dehalococcoidia bacterium]|nr:hypothetical protein [Dehalococcoidia bacterium]
MDHVLPGQIVQLGDGYREYLVREQAEAERTFTDVVDAVRDSRPRQFLALLSLDGERITHLALATRTGRVATGKVRIRYESIRQLSPVELDGLREAIAPSLRRHFASALDSDGWLPQQTWNACLGVLRRDLRNERAVSELEGQISGRPLAMTPRRLQVLTEERDALGLALEIFDPRSRITVPSVSAAAGPDAPFVTAMQNGDLPEDVGIAHDTAVFDGWLPQGVPAVGAMSFESRGHVLTVANVNRTPIEHVLGVDLLYFHAEYRSFVFVQYKRMTRDDQNHPYYRPTGTTYEREYERMLGWDARTKVRRQPAGLSEYRLGNDAFFFKVYHNPVGGPPPSGLLRGMYFPLSYWKSLVESPRIRGPRGGARITYENAERHLTNTQFADLVGNGWLGSSAQDEKMLANVVNQALGARHSITLAIAQSA